MRPGTGESVAILDTLPECKVVHDAIYYGQGLDLLPSFDLDTEEGLQAWGNSLPMRFRRQARDVVVINHNGLAPGFTTDEVWATEPEFRITADDVPFVKTAAKRILDEKNLAERAFNRITRRTSAAKGILKVLVSKCSQQE